MLTPHSSASDLVAHPAGKALLRLVRGVSGLARLDKLGLAL
jgi:hypothetical protein